MELESVEKFLKSLKFMAGSYIFHNETTEGFCDIVLPDASQLEGLSAIDADFFLYHHPYAMLDHTFAIRQTCVEAMYERRNFEDVLNDLAVRMGFSKEYYTMINQVNAIVLGSPPALEVDRVYRR